MLRHAASRFAVGGRGVRLASQSARRELPSDTTVLLVTGAPHSATPEDLLRLLAGHECGQGVELVTPVRDFRFLSTGEWLVRFSDHKHALHAYYQLSDTPDASIGLRHVAVHAAHPSKLEQAKRNEAPLGDAGGRAVSLVGLPYEADQDAVRRFLRGFEADIQNVVMLSDPDGRFSGRAFVSFTTPEAAWRAVRERHNRNMTRRYVEVSFIHGSVAPPAPASASPGDEATA